MLQSIAIFYSDEVETALAGLTYMIELLLIIFMGMVIGDIAVCMFLPMFKMREIAAM